MTPLPDPEADGPVCRRRMPVATDPLKALQTTKLPEANTLALREVLTA